MNTTLDTTKRLLEEINAAISGYDPVLREKARDILLAKAFGFAIAKDTSSGTNGHLHFSPLGNDPSNIELKTLIDAWTPQTQNERALLCAYYLQHIRRYRGMTARQIQDNLKRYGLRLTNVTVAITENAKVSPPRMRKIKVVGNTRNYYEVTNAGVEFVETMLNVSGLSKSMQKVVLENRAESDLSPTR